MYSQDPTLDRLERQLKELQSWIADLQVENRVLRERTSEGLGAGLSKGALIAGDDRRRDRPS